MLLEDKAQQVSLLPSADPSPVIAQGILTGRGEKDTVWGVLLPLLRPDRRLHVVLRTDLAPTGTQTLVVAPPGKGLWEGPRAPSLGAAACILVT